ncbi:MAG TPA: AraC family transcriptional regulator, partial [Rhodocyclaceae bacterium]|nr:AraC family transcriptional regulator [Rhodocyclaceae bacterium]
ALRRDIAVARLTKTRHSIARVAADLGYADTSAFYRAFIAWTGLSPERYRKQLAAQAPAQSAP